MQVALQCGQNRPSGVPPMSLHGPHLLLCTDLVSYRTNLSDKQGCFWRLQDITSSGRYKEKVSGTIVLYLSGCLGRSVGDSVLGRQGASRELVCGRLDSWKLLTIDQNPRMGGPFGEGDDLILAAARRGVWCDSRSSTRPRGGRLSSESRTTVCSAQLRSRRRAQLRLLDPS